MDSLFTIFSVFAFVMGASIASFLNVVIWRVPRGESIISPPSHCPKCGAAIRWWQNIPILSWLLLRGRCVNCRAPISPRYIIVETIGGVLFLAAFWKYGIFASVMWVWISLMIVGSFIDYDLQLLPDFVTVGGMVLGVAVSAVCWLIGLRGVGVIHPLASIVGLVFGFGLLWLIRFLGTKAFKREAMGMGDVFLMGAVGAIFGPIAVLVTLAASSIIGSVIGVAMILLNKTRLGGFTAIPFGPYICMGCIAWMFYGTEMVRWYMSIISPYH